MSLLIHRLYLFLDGVWRDVTADWRRDTPTSWKYGITGDGPADNVADTGSLRFALNNAEDNTGGVLGFYAPDSEFCRSGFRLGVPVMLKSFGPMEKIEFIGTMSEIEPEVGQYDTRRTLCAAVDYMDDLANAILQSLPVEAEVRANELLEIIVASLADAPPGGTQFDVGTDIYPFAFDSTGGQSALAEIQRICNSERGLFAITGEGKARFLSRSARLFGSGGRTPDLIVTKPHGMRVFRNRERLLNKIKVTSYPRDIDDTPVVLYSLAASIPVSPGATIPLVTEYRNPANTEEKISATDVVVPLESGRDYTGSVSQVILEGTPSVAATVIPTILGTYTAGSSGSVSSLGDGNTGTGMPAAGALNKTSVFFGAIPNASPNAQAGSVIFNVKLNHVANGPDDFFVLYCYLRLNGVEVLINVFDGYTNGVNSRSIPVSGPPGGGNWTVAALDQCEFVWEWNVGGPTVDNPSLVELNRTSLHVAGVLQNDRTSYISISTTAGASSASHQITNNHPTEVIYVWLQIRGRGLYKSGSIDVELLDQPSIDKYKQTRDIALDAPYQTSRDIAESFASYLLSQHKDERSVAAPLKIMGDTDLNVLNIQSLDFNSLIRVQNDPATGVNQHFYVNSVAGEIDAEGIVTKTYETVPADENTYFTIGVSKIGGPDGIAPY